MCAKRCAAPCSGPWRGAFRAGSTWPSKRCWRCGVWEAGGELLCGVRLSDETMRHRTYKVAQVEASLRPTVARALVMLSEPADGDVFLDPMCGAGTILIERGMHSRYSQLLGGDIRPDAVAATRTNVGPRYKPIDIRQWDARDLPLDDGSVDRVVCNLPFGKKVCEPQALRPLYEGFASEVARVSKGWWSGCVFDQRAHFAGRSIRCMAGAVHGARVSGRGAGAKGVLL